MLCCIWMLVLEVLLLGMLYECAVLETPVFDVWYGMLYCVLYLCAVSVCFI